MDMISELTSKDDKSACALAEKIISESRETNGWYSYFDDFTSLLNHPKSLVRNRAMGLTAANVRWDDERKFDPILPEFLSHVTDEKPVTARQCIKSLALIGQTKTEYIPAILSALQNADLSKYKDSMRPLIEKDIRQTEQMLTNLC